MKQLMSMPKTAMNLLARAEKLRSAVKFFVLYILFSFEETLFCYPDITNILYIFARLI